MSGPLISVIMPAYNAEATLEDSARSVLNQTFDDLELIIVDDGSKDGTADLCQRLEAEDNRVIHLRCQNGGVSRARNAGIDKAKGGHLAFLDADDLYAPSKLEKQLNRLEDSGADIVTTGIRRFVVEHGERKWLGESYPPDLGSAAYQTLLLDMDTTKYVIFNTVLARREVFENGLRYDPSLKTGEDWDIWIRAALNNSFATVNEPLFYYRKHANSATAGYGNWMTLNSHLRILEKNVSETVTGASLRKRREGKYLEFLGHSAYSKNYPEFIKILRKGLFDAHLYKRKRLYEVAKDLILNNIRRG
ncbi:glycosyltransferase family 2 protein [Hydrocarboniclastica marina]|uniref:glycosyltransferase family 2 protein n=1 Tax=Hydrocarboniclastica marina TaxID=2259620 RepID=UPI001561B09F|nr:glycosyltransferase family 2 protein [Hydrocarboniclastica marina]